MSRRRSSCAATCQVTLDHRNVLLEDFHLATQHAVEHSHWLVDLLDFHSPYWAVWAHPQSTNEKVSHCQAVHRELHPKTNPFDWNLWCHSTVCLQTSARHGKLGRPTQAAGPSPGACTLHLGESSGLQSDNRRSPGTRQLNLFSMISACQMFVLSYSCSSFWNVRCYINNKKSFDLTVLLQCYRLLFHIVGAMTQHWVNLKCLPYTQGCVAIVIRNWFFYYLGYHLRLPVKSPMYPWIRKEQG